VANLKVKGSSVKNPDGRRIFLPSKGFKGILAVPAGAAAVIPAEGLELGGGGAGHKFAFFVPRQSFSTV